LQTRKEGESAKNIFSGIYTVRPFTPKLDLDVNVISGGVALHTRPHENLSLA
jgi:hypothetical protein